MPSFRLRFPLRSLRRWPWAHTGVESQSPVRPMALCLKKITHRILFRCRDIGIDWNCANDPEAVVSMWVDGRLVAHYYGWNVKPRGNDRYYAGRDYQDCFGAGRVFDRNKPSV